jgi:sugar phosphate isomerase/epimerase
MKLGYGTYAMPTVDIFEALPRLHDMGYEAIEINIGEEWPTAPHKLNASDRDRIVRTLQDLNYPPPVTMCLLPICTQGDERDAVLQKFNDACVLTNDLNFGDTPTPIVSTPGGINGDWEERKNQLRDSLLFIADQAAQHNVIFAIEPHAGQMLDTPEKVTWLLEQTQHDHLKINFDISHYHVIDIDLQHSVTLSAPYTVSTHIKDGYMKDGKVNYQLPGEGTLDLIAYFKAVKAAGITCPITVEVTAQIWKKSGYDPWAAAEASFNALNNAREKARIDE